MLLLIPAIEIRNGKCVRRVVGMDGSISSDDPVEIAKLWRKENAKALHVTDIDGAIGGRLVNFNAIAQMVKSVDIPVSVGGGMRTFDEVKKALDGGAYRVVIGTMLIENPDEAKLIIEKFGPSKVILGIDAQSGIVQTKGWNASSGLTAMTVALNAKQIGFRRIVYRDILVEGEKREPHLTALRDLAEKTGMRVTASGGISNLQDLLRLQELEPYGVDSVIVGRALYENSFACQALWRFCEAGNFPYTAKV
ncbi:MAG TPA: 1-(5-phosphoribosyl)-5-[(5-phosphoribosylamino)methylideneamino] imidazole-4-carboxamide isomerase [Bacteroidota bacterium]